MTASARSTRPWLHRISKTKPPIRRRRPRRTVGGLGILLIVMTTLVVVPLAETDDAVGAHTLTEERCDFDPISGAPFNCRDVPVSHTHDTCGHPSQHAHDGRGCHPRTDVHCSSGQHAHEGVAGCHDTGTVHCGNPTQHAHDDRSCHSRNEVHCPSGQHSHVGHTSCHGTSTVHCGSPTQHAHDGRACHARTDVHCPTGQHSHTGHTSCHTTRSLLNKGLSAAGCVVGVVGVVVGVGGVGGAGEPGGVGSGQAARHQVWPLWSRPRLRRRLRLTAAARWARPIWLAATPR